MSPTEGDVEPAAARESWHGAGPDPIPPERIGPASCPSDPGASRPSDGGAEEARASLARRAGPGSSFWASCRRLIDAYPTRASEPGHADALRALRDALSVEATALATSLAPGHEWRAVATTGRASWAARPGVALLDPRQATSTRHGVFVVVDLLWQRTRAVRLGLTVAVGEEHAARRGEVLADLARGGDLDALAARGFEPVEGEARLQVEESTEDHRARLLQGGLVVQKTVLLPDDARAQARDLDDDLRALLGAYRRWVEAHGHDPLPADPTRPIDGLAGAVEALLAAGARRGLVFPAELLGSLLVSLKVSPVVLLSGPPGCGKTALVRLLGDLGVRVHQRAELDAPALRERVAAAAADSKRQHVLLLEDPPRRAAERALIDWLDERAYGDAATNLAVAWTRARPTPPCARLLDRVNVIELEPPEPSQLASVPVASGAPPGVIDGALLRPTPGGWRALRDEHGERIAAALAELQAVLRSTQEALVAHGSPVRLSWRASDAMLEYGALAVAAGLASTRVAADRAIRARLLPTLLHAGSGRPGPELVDELVDVWSRALGDGPGSASAELRAGAGRLEMT